jgi:hypothetical protein
MLPTRAVHTSNGTAVLVSRIGIGDQLSLGDLSYAIECCCRLLGEPALARHEKSLLRSASDKSPQVN